MSTHEEHKVYKGISIEDNQTLSFGNHLVLEKIKVNDFAFGGDLYKLRTHKDVTRLEKNGKLLFEAVPGATISNLKITETEILFAATGGEDAQITMELEPETEYNLFIDNANIGKLRAKASGKISFNLEFHDTKKFIKIQKA